VGQAVRGVTGRDEAAGGGHDVTGGHDETGGDEDETGGDETAGEAEAAGGGGRAGTLAAGAGAGAGAGGGSRRWRVGLVGLGWVARRVWMPLLEADGRFEVVAGFDRTPGVAVAAGLAGCADPLDLLDHDLDAVFVTVPNNLHCAVAEPFLDAGVCAFVEKPLCLGPAEADRLVAAAERGGAALVPSAASRLRGDCAAFRELVAADLAGGAAGYHLQMEWVRSRGVPAPGGWFTDRRQSGGGALLDLGWHLLDVGLHTVDFPAVLTSLALPLDGYADPRYAAGWRGDGDVAAAVPPDVEGSCVAMLALDGGGVAEVRAAWASNRERDMTRLAFARPGFSVELRTTFGFTTNGIADVGLVVRRDGVDERLPLPDEPRGRGYERQLDVLDGVLAGRVDWRTEADRACRLARITAGLYATFPDAAHRPEWAVEAAAAAGAPAATGVLGVPRPGRQRGPADEPLPVGF
jgi:oxidoreductase